MGKKTSALNPKSNTQLEFGGTGFRLCETGCCGWDANHPCSGPQAWTDRRMLQAYKECGSGGNSSAMAE